jgi:hypothetical protein
MISVQKVSRHTITSCPLHANAIQQLLAEYSDLTRDLNGFVVKEMELYFTHIPPPVQGVLQEHSGSIPKLRHTKVWYLGSGKVTPKNGIASTRNFDDNWIQFGTKRLSEYALF